ncbi:MAG TPA: GFA family protein, partial [Methylophilaceae bacterium]|nr:GFA family protein [Methylophilaceae bacterium]
SVTYEAEIEPGPAIECNCSICSRKGYLLWFTPRGNLHIKSGEDQLSVYTFGPHIIKHHFCPTCGCAVFGIGKAPGTDSEMAAINVRCLEGIELEEIERKPFDGRSL